MTVAYQWTMPSVGRRLSNQHKSDLGPTTTTSTSGFSSSSRCRLPPVLSALGDAMSALTASVRHCARRQLPLARASCLALVPQRRGISEASSTSSFDSPFKGYGSSEKTTSIPSFAKYRSSGGETSGKVYQYFLVGTFGAVSAFGAKKTVTGA